MYRILIVDDEPLIRQGLKHIVSWEEYGFSICGFAKNGMEAVELFDRLQPDLIITDIYMPDMNGLELIRFLRIKRKSGIRFVVLSGYRDFDYARQAIKYNVMSYVLKPIDEDELIEVLRKISTDIETERTQQENQRSYQYAAAKETLITMLQGKATDDKISEMLVYYSKLRRGSYHYCIVRMLEQECVVRADGEKAKQNAGFLIKSILPSDIHPFIIEESTEICGILLCSSIFGEYVSLQTFIEAFRQKIEENSSASFFITIGREAHALNEIHNSYRTAIIAQEYLLYQEANAVLYFEAITPFIHQRVYDQGKPFNLLLNAIKNNQPDKIPLLLEEWTEALKNTMAEPTTVKLYLIDFVMKAQEFLEDLGGRAEIASNFCKVLEQLFHQLILKEIKTLMLDFCRDCCSSVSDLRFKIGLGVISEVISYIDQNLHQKFTLKSIAGRFYINSAYLGQLFSKKLGISFNEYVHRRRIEAAKHLLLNTNFKVYEVSRAIGYKDPNYFIVRFMKEVCMTPTEYRGKHLNRNEKTNF